MKHSVIIVFFSDSPSGDRPYYPHHVPSCPTRIAFSSGAAHSFPGPGTYSANTHLFSGLMQPFPGPGPYPIQQMEYSSMYDRRLVSGSKRPCLSAFGGEDHTETDSSGSKRPYLSEFRGEDQNSSEDKTHERQDHKSKLFCHFPLHIVMSYIDYVFDTKCTLNI